MRSILFLFSGIFAGLYLSWPGILIVNNWKCFNEIIERSAEDRISIKAILEIPLLVKSNLSEPVVSMSKLLRMKAGDTLNVNLEDTVDFYVENQKYFKAEMGELNGNASVKLATRNN